MYTLKIKNDAIFTGTKDECYAYFYANIAHKKGMNFALALGKAKIEQAA